MRSSAPEGPHAPRAKQTPPSGSSGATAGPAGATPTSPRPQPSASIQSKAANQSQIRSSAGIPSLSSQNRGSSHPRNISSHPQLQRSQPRSTQSQNQAQHQQQQQLHQKSPPLSSSSGNSQNTNLKSPTASLSKSIQPRLPTQTNQKTSPQALPKSQSSFNSAPQAQSPSQAIKTSSIKQGSSSTKSTQQQSPSSSSSNQPPNFGEYDDQEWDVNVGHLIIDLDADIAQADRGRMSGAPVPSSGSHGVHQSAASGVPISEDKHSLKMKIKRTKPPTKTSEAKHEMVKPDVMPTSTGIVMVQGNQVSSQHNGAPTKGENNSMNANTPRGSAAPRSIYKKEKRRIDVNGTSSPPPSGSPSVSIRTGGSHSTSVTISQISTPTSAITTHSLSIPISCSQGITSVTATPSTVSCSYPHIPQSKLETAIPVGRVSQSALQQGVSSAQQNNTSSQSHLDSSSSQHEAVSPVAKRKKMNEESKRDACVGTSVATITEPDCLGPCEPGSSVTLEGIVWHETEGGVLVVNVTWRGKTYVGTLLDCTKHDWAPPRFCDSPTSDLESRTPKGRAKRGRAAATTSTTATATTTVNTTTTTSSCSSGNSSGSGSTPELSITETRSGKLRNASTKGRRGNSSITFNPPLSPVKSEPPGNKRKAKEIESVIVQDSKNKKAKTRSTPTNGCSSPSPEQITNQTTQQVPSPSSSNDIPQPPESPQLIECPAQNCGKKYRHVNGLKYHQSHAHSSTQSTNEDGNNILSSVEANDEKSSPPSPKLLASTIIDTSQELIKPSALRPNIVLKSEDDNLSPAFESLTVQHSNSSKSPQPYAFSNSMSVNAQKQSNALNCRLNTTQSEGQSINVVNLNGLEATPNQHSTQEPSLTNLPQSNAEIIVSSHNSVLPPSTQAIIVSQAKSSHEEQSPQYSSVMSSVCHQSSSQQTITPVQVQPNTTVVSQQSQTHSVQQQSLPSNTLHSQVPHSQNLVFNSQHGLQQKPIQISAQHQQQQPHPPPQHSPQQQQQLNQPHLSQQQSSGQSPQQLKPQATHPQAQQSQNFKIQSNLSTTTTQPIVSYPVQMQEHSQPSHASHQIIRQSPSRVEVKPEILSRMNPVHNSSQILPTNRPPPLITLSDTTPPPNSVSSTTPAAVPQGTQLSSLPGSSVASIKIKQGLENEKFISLKQKDIVNGLTKKDSLEQEEEPVNRDDARSPAYSDISDANDTAPVIDEDAEAKEFKEDNKKDLPIGGAPPYAYGLYLGGYGQPHPPYLMPPLQHPQNISLKAGENKDLKDKSQIDKGKKDYPPVPGTSDYLKFPAQYLYSQYSTIYAPGYPDPYIRDPIYKDVIDKAKSVESIEDNGGQEEEKGPTDLSRNSMNLTEKSTKDNKPLDKMDTGRIHQLPTEKRTIDSALAYRYINPYDSRIPLVGSTIDKTNEVKSTTPIPLSSPRLGSTPPSSINSNAKEEKIEKLENKNEGVKPTMETTGPPPPPTSTAYYPPFPYAHVPFDPYRPPIVPGISLAAGFPPYLAAAAPGLGGLRYQLGVPSGPEDLSPNGASGSPLLPSGLYTGPHKIAELQETQKPPPNQPVSSSGSTIRGGSPLSIMQNSLTGQSPHSMQIVSPPFGTPSQPSSVHLGERKTPPVGSRLPGHPSLPEGYPYPILPAQFPPHFTALGVSPTAIPQVGVGGPGVVPSGMGGGAPQPK